MKNLFLFLLLVIVTFSSVLYGNNTISNNPNYEMIASLEIVSNEGCSTKNELTYRLPIVINPCAQQMVNLVESLNETTELTQTQINVVARAVYNKCMRNNAAK